MLETSTPLLRLAMPSDLTGRVVREGVIHQPGTRGRAQELGAQPEQAARRDHIVEPHTALAVGLHVGNSPLRAPSISITVPWCVLLHVDGELLERLAALGRRSPCRSPAVWRWPSRSLRAACSRSVWTNAARLARRPGTCPGRRWATREARRCGSARAPGAPQVPAGEITPAAPGKG